MGSVQNMSWIETRDKPGTWFVFVRNIYIPTLNPTIYWLEIFSGGIFVMWCLGNMWNWSFTLLETGNKQGKVSKIFTMKLSLKFLFRFPLLSVWYLCYLLDMWQVCLYFLLECWKKVQMCQLLPRSAASPEGTGSRAAEDSALQMINCGYIIKWRHSSSF